MVDDLTRRAMAAYWRTEGEDADIPANDSGPEDHGGKKYVVLRNARGVLAVYRVRTSGALKRLRRWPAALGEGWNNARTEGMGSKDDLVRRLNRTL